MMKTLMICVMRTVGILSAAFFLWADLAVSQELPIKSSAFADQWPINYSGNGIVMDSQKQLIYLGDGDSINILDSNLNFISSFIVTDSNDIGGLFYSATDNLLYIACGPEGLKIYDLTDPENPLFIISYLPDFDSFFPDYDETLGVFIDGSKAYLSSGIDGMIIIDITDINNPSMLSHTRLQGAAGLSYAVDTYAAGNFAFVADLINGLYVFDVSNPLEPIWKKGFTGAGASDIEVSDDYLYLTLQSSGMAILDISKPEDTFQIGAFQAEGVATSVRVDGNFAFISYESFGIRALNITNKAEPFHDPTWIYDASGGSSLGLFHDENFLFYANYQFGLQKIDITDKSNMQPLASHDTPADAIAIDVSGNYMYAVDNNIDDSPEKEGLRIYWLDTTSTPGEVNYIFHYKGFCATPGTANDIQADGDFAFVADGQEGLQIINISDKTSPEIIRNYDTSGNSCGVFIAGNYAYLADGDQGIVIIDITDKTNPTLTANLDTDGFARKIFISGDYAYVADGIFGVQIINITDKTAPDIIGNFDTSGTANGIFVKGNYAYVADGPQGIVIIDITDKSTPILVSTYNTDGSAENISVSGNYVYVADGQNGLCTIDASNPSQPASINEWSYKSPGIATDVFSGFSNDNEELYTFLAAGAAGIIAVNLSIDDINTDASPSGSSGGCFLQTMGR